MRYIIILLLVILSVALGSCGPGAKLARAKRLIAKAEAAGAEWSVDTIKTTITVTVPKIEFDTVLRQVNFFDTLVVEKEKVITRIKINTETKEVYVKTTCPEKKKKFVVTHTIKKTINAGMTTWDAVKMFLIGFAAGVILCGAYRLLR